MTKPDTKFVGDERYRIGRYLNIRPDKMQEHIEIIDKLLWIEESKGQTALMEEIRRMMAP